MGDGEAAQEQIRQMEEQYLIVEKILFKLTNELES